MKNGRQRFRKLTAGLVLSVLLMAPGWVAAAERLTVKAGIANMRFGPGTKYEVLWQVEKYHPFVVVEKQKNWYKVKDFEGDMAWIHNSLLANTRGVITVKSKCNVREKPTTKSRVVFTVERGVPFRVLKESGKWLRIQHADGEAGWIFNTLVW